MLFKISNSFFYTQKVAYFVFKDSSSPKQVVLICSAPTYLRCIADQTRLKYDQPTVYRGPPSCTSAQHTTCGERDHPRQFFNRLKKLIPLTTTSQSGSDQYPLYFRPAYAVPDQGPLIADPSIFPER